METKNCEVTLLLVNNLGFSHKKKVSIAHTKLKSIKCNARSKLIIDFRVTTTGFLP